MTLLITAFVLSICVAIRKHRVKETPQSKVLFGGKVRLCELWNDKAAFSFPVRLPTLMTASMSAMLLLWLRRKSHPIGTGLILGGGLSNFFERLCFGRVYDYIQFPKVPKLKRYVFNFADFTVLLGSLLLLCPGRNKLNRSKRKNKGSIE